MFLRSVDITSSTLYRITFPILGFPQIPLHGKDPSRLCQCHPYPPTRRQVQCEGPFKVVGNISTPQEFLYLLLVLKGWSRLHVP